MLRPYSRHTRALTILSAHFLGHHTQALTIPSAKSLHYHTQALTMTSSLIHHTQAHSTPMAHFHGSSTQALTIPSAHFLGHHRPTWAHRMHLGPQPHAGMSAQPYILAYYIIQAHPKSLRVIRLHRAKIMQAGREHRYKVTTVCG